MFNDTSVVAVQSNQCPLLRQCAQNRCVELRHGLSLTENGHSYVEIEDNEVCVGQASGGSSVEPVLSLQIVAT